MTGCAAVAVFAVLVAGLAGCDRAASREPAARDPSASTAAATSARALPRLVDLGAGKCIPCKAMAPILEQLRADYAGRMDVVFIDVWQRPEEARRYGVQMIPTQIFYAADGKELARHEGFLDRDGILGAWAKLGVEL
jgi:thioredoxin 1